MGTHFFQKNVQKSPQIGGGSQNLEARAIGASAAAGLRAGGGAAKDIGMAQGINKAGFTGPMKRGAAYAPGPKKT